MQFMKKEVSGIKFAYNMHNNHKKYKKINKEQDI